MKRLTLSLVLLVVAGTLGRAAADDLPKTQPKVLTIYREQLKVGKAAEHSKLEAGYPAALEKANHPNHYLALVSMTGPSEVWYLEPSDSFKAIDDTIKRDAKDPVLSAEMDRLALADAEYITSSRVMRARAVSDLSVGTFPDLSKARYFEISIFRIRPGFEPKFEEMSKTYAAMIKRGAPKAQYRVYEVLAGERLPIYLIISSMENYGELDQRLTEGETAWKGATADEMKVLSQFNEVAESVETNHYRVDPAQSYVSKATRASDPEFWNVK